jgi:hypothetical protein
MYKSKYPPNCPPTNSTFGKAAVTQIPVANVAGDYEAEPGNHSYQKSGAVFGNRPHYSDTTSFVRKNTKPPLPEGKLSFVRVQVESVCYRDSYLLKFNIPSVTPFRYETKVKPALDNRTTLEFKRNRTNFIKDNALEVIMSSKCINS